MEPVITRRPLPTLLFGVWLGLLPGCAAPAAGAASEVILLRHADKDVSRGDYNLSPEGFVRAIKLAAMIPGCLGTPTQIVTFFMNSQTSRNARSYQSAVPLAVATGVNVVISTESLDDSYGVGQRLRKRAAEPSQRLVLFWEHRRMPELARGLGWNSMPPIAAGDFDQMVVLRYPTPDSPPEVHRYRQSELFQRACAHHTRPTWFNPGL